MVSDQCMPGAIGLEVLELLRANGCTLPFVLISADLTTPLQRQAGRLGVSAALSNPLDIIAFRESIRGVISRRDKPPWLSTRSRAASCTIQYPVHRATTRGRRDEVDCASPTDHLSIWRAPCVILEQEDDAVARRTRRAATKPTPKQERAPEDGAGSTPTPHPGDSPTRLVVLLFGISFLLLVVGGVLMSRC